MKAPPRACPAARYAIQPRMIDPPLPLAPELCAPAPAPEPAPCLEQLAMLRLENAALRAHNAALQERIRELEARLPVSAPSTARGLNAYEYIY